MWLALALLTALFESGKDIFAKQGLNAGADPLTVAWAWRLLAVPFLLPPVLLSAPVMPQPGFWPALVVGGILNVTTAVLYMRALRASDISLCVPLISFTPLFLLITSPLLVGESAGPWGTAGVALIVAGAYLLNLDKNNQGLLAPLRALWHERGARLMLLVALIWSLTANIDKIGINNSSPLLWAVSINAAIALGLLPLIFLRRARAPIGPLPWRLLAAVGLCGGLTTLCQMLAISLTLVPYVIAVKRLSILLTVLAGALLLREPGLRQRLPAAVLMLSGVIVLTLA
jgi:drug/metabolite transporter (DMT)-like permease